ncbi:unnamed protein product [Nezara viridula]|uniref:Elongation of very long chain fatty acids protein n=1 Tax=Nezara viridula TaxID=85310 RepID=A0A9P0HG29_NEZVI|nr:unnamed protein product [Nezara viridula]
MYSRIPFQLQLQCEVMELIGNIYRNNTFPYGPRVEDHYPSLFLKFHHVFITMMLYILLVKVFGPMIMRKRKPFSLKIIMMAYNLSQVLLNFYLLHKAILYWHSWIPKFWNHVCNPISETMGFTEENKMTYMQMMYYFYLTKLVDLLDTVFFVLRKKQSQVTFLHIFHHTSMVFNMWVSLIYLREEVISIFGIMNGTVHVIMYMYYFLAAFGPGIQKYLWWKKYLTKLQLVQFVIMIAISVKVKLIDCDCNPWFWTMWSFSVTVYFILFVHFYVTSYRKVKKV